MVLHFLKRIYRIGPGYHQRMGFRAWVEASDVSAHQDLTLRLLLEVRDTGKPKLGRKNERRRGRGK